MSGRKRIKNGHCAEKDFSIHPRTFMFVDKRTGTQRFEVKAGADGSMPVDEATSLLVVHCLMRNQTPNDFQVMVPAAESLLDGLRQRARKLIHACPLIQASFQLTSRQQEVLRGVQQGLSNKEIATTLNLSERTVKFHVSALLLKFDVAGRTGLILRTNDLLSVAGVPTGVNSPQLRTGNEQVAGQELRNSKERLVPMNLLERRSRG
jgi:DNA-binding NarL/FixJ family response regulator